jgi:cytochrome c heme-lyase
MRYVVDFYPGKGADSSIANATTNSSDPNHQPVPNLSFYLDVRPALDSWEGVRMRLLRAWDDIVGPKSPSSSPSEPGQKS